MSIASGIISNHQVKNLVSSPVELIPSPGPGKIIVIVNCVSKMIYGGSNPFQDNGGNGLSVTYGPTSIFQACLFLASQCITSEVDQVAVNACNANSSAGYAVAANTGVYLNNISGVNISGNAAGDNFLSWYIDYNIVSI